MRATAALNSFSFPNRNNRGLARSMLRLVADERIGHYIMKPSRRSEWVSETFTNLVTAFRSAGKTDDHSHYNASTCVEFHRLLIATLLVYGRALCALKVAKDEASQREHCGNAWICSGLLGEIASSLMLRQHMQNCAYEEGLRIPTNTPRSFQKYQTYTGFTEFKPNGDDIDEPREIITPPGNQTIDEVYVKWVCLQVIHLLSLRMLSRAFGSASSPAAPTVRLLAVRYPKWREMEPWETTVKNLVPSQAENVIKSIVEHVNDDKESERHFVFGKWRVAFKKGQPLKFNGTRHCEVILASLAKFAHLLPDGEPREEVMQFLQVMLYWCNYFCLSI